MGAPEYLSGSQVEKLQDASQLKRERVNFRYAEGRIDFEVALPANSVAAIEFEFPPNCQSGGLR